ncbi:uncharacterized protein BDR25DRAFT_125901 [Lindgomyces ingoldianus]|uniref:Uncharacterized protein n=1 Tax=Lindgomyces ingoldianus TaxID=673940 RepID=A0ACB6R4A7_9PLEO|nr:uncharacterized protein BDR25DRAFT_125901 [Lindgomyces ingoldianus]KAF2473897.1 hypothetical protein BDR25DRAFT_125901 [Lindgomyces ingoldianus]
MSLSRDAGAPTEISQEDFQKFEERNDVKSLRASLEKAHEMGDDKKTKSSIRSRIQYHLGVLSRMQLLENRKNYFDRVDNLRAQGLPTTDSAGESRPGKALPKYGGGAEAAVARFLQECARNVHEGLSVDHRSRVYMEHLVNYLAHRPPISPPLESGFPKVWSDPSGRQKSVDAADDKAQTAQSIDDDQNGCLENRKTTYL